MGLIDNLRGLLGGVPDRTEEQQAEPSPLAELGSSGLRQQGGQLNEEWDPRLHGERGVRAYREMSESDPTVGAVLFAIEMLIRQAHWGVDPASSDERDVENAAFLESCMNDLDKPWESFISEVLTMLVYGWSVHEVAMKVRRGPDARPSSAARDGRIGWSKLAIRGQNTLLK